MLETLRAHHERIRACLLIHRELCSAVAPEGGRLVLSRLRLLTAKAERSRFLARHVLPLLEDSADGVIDELVTRLAIDHAARQDAIKAHLKRWDALSIERDWEAYQAAATRFMASVEERIRLEADALGPTLTRIGAI